MHIQIPVKYLKKSFLRKRLTAKSKRYASETIFDVLLQIPNRLCVSWLIALSDIKFANI